MNVLLIQEVHILLKKFLLNVIKVLLYYFKISFKESKYA